MILKILFFIFLAIAIWQETIVLVKAFRGDDVSAITLVIASISLAFVISYLIGTWS